MRKTTMMLSLSLVFISSVFATEVREEYTHLVHYNFDISSYKSNNGKYYVIDAPIGKFKLDFSAVGKKSKKNKHGGQLYERQSIYDHYLDKDDGSGFLYAMLNGQFFGKYSGHTAQFAFPLKGKNKIFHDTDTQTQYAKKTLYMAQVKDKQIPIFMNGFHKGLFKHSLISDAITALDPYHKKTKEDKLKVEEKIGRHYIGCIPLKEYNTNLATCRNLIFIQSNEATHTDMLEEMKKWGVKEHHIMAMDGSGSARLYSTMMVHSGIVERAGLNSLGFADWRDLPNVISIYR